MCIIFLLACDTLGFAGGRAAQESKSGPQRYPAAAKEPANNTLRGTDDWPISVKVLPTPKTVEEISQEKKDRDDISGANWWMVRLTAAIGLVGLLQLFIFGLQARRLRQTIKKMDEIAKGQTKDMQASISEATRSASAMEGVAQSLVLTTNSNEQSVSISREIADRQKLITVLSSRAYLYAGLHMATYQDADHVFEIRAFLANRGNTPAYNVTFKATLALLPSPIPDDFEFPLPADTAGTSVSFMAPGVTKLITRGLPERVPDEDVEAIKRGRPPRCLAMWGIVDYQDAFKEPRVLKFAFSVSWIGWVAGKGVDKDGNPLPENALSHDTNHHNEAS